MGARKGRTVPQARIALSEADIKVLIDAGKLEITDGEENTEAPGARVFTVTEHEKKRRRPIWEPFLNDGFERRGEEEQWEGGWPSRSISQDGTISSS